MKGYWESLRPFEKRVVVGVAALFFVVLNFLFVFPYFSQWSRVQRRMTIAQELIDKYQKEIMQTNVYTVRLRELEREGLEVPPEDQVRHFGNTINSQAGRSQVQLTSGGRNVTSTNAFFIEQSQTITAAATEPALIDFLYTLGTGNSLIRVRDLNVRPDPPRQNLMASITLVASYQKKQPGRAGQGTTPAKPGSGPGKGSSPLAQSPGADVQPLTSSK
jgi:hypothetical protein